MPLTSTSRSTRPLSEVARVLVYPAGNESSGWPKVEQRCAEFGDKFDEWQRGAGMVILGRDASGIYTATIGGITLSIPRQVAKTFLVGRIVFALCTLFPGLRVIWTAHRTRTATNTFGSLRRFAGRKTVAPYVANIRAANGEQEIAFTNGSVIMFGAREQGFGRGFDEVDVEVFDEAQILTEKALEDMVAATNQSRHPHGALLFYMGTPPRPVDPGDAFKARRRDALAAKAAQDAGDPAEVDAVYIECSADSNANPDDREQWAKANPSFPHRTPLRSMLRLRKNLVSDEAWKREALGIWDEEAAAGDERAISKDAWEAVGVDGYPTDGVPSYGVAFSMDGSRLALAGSFLSDETAHLEILAALATAEAADEGLAKLADWFTAAAPNGEPRWKNAAAIVLSGSAGASVLKQLLVDRGVKERVIRIANTPQYLAACGMLDDAVKAKTITRLVSDGQSALDDSIAAVKKDKRGGWVASTADGDETPVEAISLALWGSRTSRQRSGAAVFR